MITLSKYDSQIVLYAKHNFKRPPGLLIQDLAVLVGLRCAINPEFIGEKDIIKVLLILVEELNLKDEFFKRDFFLEMIYGFPYTMHVGQENETIPYRVIKMIMSLFANLQVQRKPNYHIDEWIELIHLEPLDETIFPELGKLVDVTA